MKKTIGVVAEGPRDFDLISALIDDITGEENDFQHLQPEPNANGEFGNGWKGVWKWCESHQEYLHEFFYSVTPHLDMLVIHMDADVSRREKEVHCWCNQSQCTANQGVHPLSCSHAIEKSKGTYRKFIDYVVPNWSQVCSKCPQARAFDRDIRYLLTELPQKDDNVEVIGTV